MAGPLMQGVAMAQQRRAGERAQAIQAQQNKLVPSAYMGDPNAIQDLMAVNPELGMKVQQAVSQRQASQQQAQLEKRSRFETDYNAIMGNIAKFPDAESARSYAESRIADLQNRYPEIMQTVGEDGGYDEEDYNQAKSMFSPKPSQLGQKINEYKQALNRGDQAAAAIYEKDFAGKGMRISFDENGNPVVETGVSGGLTKPAQTQVEKDLLAKTSAVFQLEDIVKNLDPTAQTLGAQFDRFVTEGKSYLGLDIPPEQEESYNKMIDQRAAIGELVATIRNDLFGSALTETERKSAGVFLPDVERDKPVELKRKVERMMKTSKRAVARLNYIRKFGLEMKDIPLEKIDSLMSDRAKQLHESIKEENPSLSEQEIKRLVLQSVRQEFGLVK